MLDGKAIRPRGEHDDVGNGIAFFCFQTSENLARGAFKKLYLNAGLFFKLSNILGIESSGRRHVDGNDAFIGLSCRKGTREKNGCRNGCG